MSGVVCVRQWLTVSRGSPPIRQLGRIQNCYVEEDYPFNNCRHEEGSYLFKNCRHEEGFSPNRDLLLVGITDTARNSRSLVALKGSS